MPLFCISFSISLMLISSLNIISLISLNPSFCSLNTWYLSLISLTLGIFFTPTQPNNNLKSDILSAWTKQLCRLCSSIIASRMCSQYLSSSSDGLPLQDCFINMSLVFGEPKLYILLRQLQYSFSRSASASLDSQTATIFSAKPTARSIISKAALLQSTLHNKQNLSSPSRTNINSSAPSRSIFIFSRYQTCCRWARLKNTIISVVILSCYLRGAHSFIVRQRAADISYQCICGVSYQCIRGVYNIKYYYLNIISYILLRNGYMRLVLKHIILQFHMENPKKKLILPIEQQCSSIYQNYKYSQSGPKPSLYFWKQLTQIARQTACLLIPDTLIVDSKGNSFLWIYTNAQGRVSSNCHVSLKDFVAKVTHYCSPNELAATIKRTTIKQGHNNYGNDVRLVNSRYLHNISLQQFGHATICIQKYIKSRGKNAFICRTVYRQNQHSYCFMITNKVSYYQDDVPQPKRFLVNPLKKATIVKSSYGKNLKQTLGYLQDVVRYFRMQRGMRLTELVGDFIKDEEGNWWLVSVKAFEIQVKMYIAPSQLKVVQAGGDEQLAKQKYQKTKMCKYCQKSFLQSQLTHKMTRKMLIEVDRYLLHLGKDYKWLKRSDCGIDLHCLYQQQKICQRCYRLYIEIQELINFEDTFLRKLGFQLDKHPKELLMSLTNTEQLQLQSKNKYIHNLKAQIPEQISLGPNSSILFLENCPLRNDQVINRMIRYRFILYFHELDEVCNVKSHHNYYLEYSLFGIKTRFKIDCHIQSKVVPIRKLRVGYFFTNNQMQGRNSCLQEYIANTVTFKINLVAQGRQNKQRKVVGQLNLDMKQCFGRCASKKSVYKFFNVEDVSYGWGLQANIGLIGTQEEVNTSRLLLSTCDKLIYHPNENYYLCEYLPQEWIDQITNKNKHQYNLSQTLLGSSDNGRNETKQEQPQQEKEEEKEHSYWQAELHKEVIAYQKAITH